MTRQFEGSAVTPGPLDTSPWTLGGRVPGPLGFRQVDLAQKGATKAVKSLPMPPPWASSTIMRVRVINWKISKGLPARSDVSQGALPNCPVAAILAALAHTTIGQKHIDGMVTEYVGTAVRTTISEATLERFREATKDEDPRDYTEQAKEVGSSRYFTVRLGKDIEVHDTFYCEYSDDVAYVKPIFMGSPTGMLWPCVIEKACATLYGSYAEMGNYRKHTANEFWKLLVGSDPKTLRVTDTTDVEKIRDAARNAPRVPTMAASNDHAVDPKLVKTQVTHWHGFAVLGIQGADIQLYDPAKAKAIALSLEDFRKQFQLILFGNP